MGDIATLRGQKENSLRVACQLISHALTRLGTAGASVLSGSDRAFQAETVAMQTEEAIQ